MRNVALLLMSIAAAVAQTTPEPGLRRNWEEARREGRAMLERGMYPEAEKLLGSAFGLAHRFRTPDGAAGEEMAASMHDLADLWRATGKLPQAEALYSSALAIRERILGENNPALAPDIDALAWTLLSEGKMPLSCGHFRRSLALLETAQGPDSPDLVPAIVNLARVLQILKEEPETTQLLERCIAIAEKANGPDHPEVANALVRAARHAAKDHADVAEQELIRAAAILEKAHGAKSMQVIAPLEELAGLFMRQKRWTDAEPLWRRIITTREWATGPLKPDLAPPLEALAGAWLETKRFADAEAALRRAYDLWVLKFGPEHALVASVLDRIAFAAAMQGDHAGAEAAYRQALWIREREIAPNLNNVALVLEAQTKRKEAEPFYIAAIAVLERSKPPAKPDHPELLNATCVNYAKLLQHLGRKAAAVRIERRAKALEAAMQPRTAAAAIAAQP